MNATKRTQLKEALTIVWFVNSLKGINSPNISNLSTRQMKFINNSLEGINNRKIYLINH
jgi:hypothetical protein